MAHEDEGEKAVGYRIAAAPPPPIVTKLEAYGLLERGFYAVAAPIGVLGAICAVGLAGRGSPSLLLGALFAGVVAVGLAAFGRYGRTSVNVEHRRHAGVIELVTHGFLTRGTRRALMLDEIVAVRLDPLELTTQLTAKMAMLVIEMVDGRIEHVFGRPIGLPLDEAESLRAKLEASIEDARPDRLLQARIADDLDEEASDPTATVGEGARARRRSR